jgi:murein DD-endopeptidase MepM/ murein hydrolase activator NlpD
MPIVKNKFYTSLLIGVGLAFATTYSYAKASHTSSKKHAFVASKHGKKHPVSSKNNRIHTHNQVVKSSQKHQAEHLASLDTQQTFAKTKAFQPGKPYFEKTLSPVSIKIPHLPSDNPLVKVERVDRDNRIHSVIGAKNQANLFDATTLDESPHHFNTAHGVIYSSMAAAAEEAGLSEDLVIQLTNIFAWDIDFATNLHSGDQFTVVYENGYDKAKIIAAEFVSNGRILTAVRYEDSEGNVNYYTPEGKLMRKTFLSSPVDYARISSHFDANRRHPILNRIRAHKGVDYAARTGTPVKSSGDGTIAFMGRKGGYGQVVVIKHGDRYETLYAHLSNFKRGLIEGDTVNQGEVIGYVGQTGLATGPHLHYEFRVDGVHRNPETSNARHELALSENQLNDFKYQARPLLERLYQAKAETMLVKNQSRPN